MFKNNYVLIIANMPDKKNEKDGMVQREIAIDQIFNQYNRVYIDREKNIKFWKFPKRWVKGFFNTNKYKLDIFKNNKVKIVYGNVSNRKLHVFLKNAKLIYIHSLYKLSSIPLEFIKEFEDKIIVDIHGCVVEELKYMNVEQDIIKKFEEYESYGFRNIKALVSVSDNMIDFYKSKYPNIETEFIKLPIFSVINIDEKIIKSKNNSSVIYSGGSQKWQNIDIMCDSIKKIASRYSCTILTPDINIFNNKLEQINDKITIKTVPSNELSKEYEHAGFGYILRDDIIVNKVACPTKVIEYMNYGIIPIVLQPEIGDFNKLGYSYILNEDFVNGNIPTEEELTKMRLNNFKIIKNFKNQIEKEKNKLICLLEDENV